MESLRKLHGKDHILENVGREMKIFGECRNCIHSEPPRGGDQYMLWCKKQELNRCRAGLQNCGMFDDGKNKIVKPISKKR